MSRGTWPGSGPRFDAQGVLAGSKDAGRCIGYLTKYLTKHVADCHETGTEAQRPARRPARRRAALRAVLADVRELAALRHPAQERASPGCGRATARARPTAATTSATPDAGSWSPANGRARRSPTTAPTARPGCWPCSASPPTAPTGTAWELVTPSDPDHMPMPRRLLHVLADRARWQAALTEARRRAQDATGDLSATGRAA